MNTTDNFVEKLNYYQSANSDSKTIKQNFVIRIYEFESIISTLSYKDWDDSLQHELILGRRGSGKSTLIKRIEIELTENKKLAKKYIPINLAEEQAGIYRLHDLWYETFLELQNKLNFSVVLKDFDTFESPYDYTQYLFFKINKVLEKKKKKVVLLLDNFDRILDNFKEDVKMLRDFLINRNNIQIIGGSTRINEHFWQYDRPFYDFFRQHLLKALSFDEIHVLLNSWSKIMNKPELKDYAINNRGKIESIRILTDGMPRTLQFFIRILLTDKEIYGFNYIKKIMDNATPLYQEKLNSLTPAQRKIVSEMAFIWEPTTTKELVNKCRMESKLVSSYLKQLNGLGVIDTLDTKNRNKKYRISERFFNMWLIVTQGNPTQKRKAKYLTIFIESWYSEHKIKELAKKHLNKVQEGKMSYGKASVKTKAFAQSQYIGALMRDSLIYSTNLLNDNMIINELPELSSDIMRKAIKFNKEGKYKLALQEINKLENESDGLKFIKLAEVYFLQFIKNTSNKELASKALLFYDKSIGIIKQYYQDGKEDIYKIIYNKLYEPIYRNISSIYLITKDFRKYKEILEEAIKLNLNFAKIGKAVMLLQENKLKKEALELISVNKGDIVDRIVFSSLIEIWNNKFNDVKNKLDFIFESKWDNDYFIKMLLFLEQKNLVLSYFESKEHGDYLKDKYRLLYYATLILTNNIEDVHLKIPKEVIPTVNHIVEEIKDKNIFYNQQSNGKYGYLM